MKFYDNYNDKLLINDYKKSLLYINKNIKVKVNNNFFIGKFVNITKDGFLIINKDKKNHILTSGSMELFK